jgi:hypothetical protein
MRHRWTTIFIVCVDDENEARRRHELLVAKKEKQTAIKLPPLYSMSTQLLQSLDRNTNLHLRSSRDFNVIGCLLLPIRLISFLPPLLRCSQVYEQPPSP